MKRIAVIGCGAIAGSFHLPGLMKLGKSAVSPVLVDPDLDRARSLAARFGLQDVAAGHAEVASELDAALLCTPHHLHVPIALELVEQGVPVLSEKPLGTSVEEVERLRDLARDRGVVVAVNQTRRFIPACMEIRKRVADGTLGALRSLHMSEGDRFDWPAATPSMFGARSGGRGVLLDIGVHALDLAAWWLGDTLELESYQDDSFGGSEAAVRARFRAGAAVVDLRLSWLAKQSNRYVLQGERGALTWDVYDLDRIRVSDGPGRPFRTVRLPGAPPSFADLAPRVLADFLAAVSGKGRAAVGAADVLPAMRLIERCYARRTRLPMPWHHFSTEMAHVG